MGIRILRQTCSFLHLAKGKHLFFCPVPRARSRGSCHMGKRGQDVSAKNRFKVGRPQCAGSQCVGKTQLCPPAPW